MSTVHLILVMPWQAHPAHPMVYMHCTPYKSFDNVACFIPMTDLQHAYLAIVMPQQMCSAALNLKPHALHVMQVVGLVPVFGEHGSRLLCLLYLPCPELPLC